MTKLSINTALPSIARYLISPHYQTSQHCQISSHYRILPLYKNDFVIWYYISKQHLTLPLFIVQVAVVDVDADDGWDWMEWMLVAVWCVYGVGRRNMRKSSEASADDYRLQIFSLSWLECGKVILILCAIDKLSIMPTLCFYLIFNFFLLLYERFIHPSLIPVRRCRIL